MTTHYCMTQPCPICVGVAHYAASPGAVWLLAAESEPLLWEGDQA